MSIPNRRHPLPARFYPQGYSFAITFVASGWSSMTESPQSVWPFHGPLPVAINMLPLTESITAPARPQMADSFESQNCGCQARSVAAQ